MDGDQFDGLTRALGRGVSRRRVLRGLVGGTAGIAGVAAIGRRERSVAAMTEDDCWNSGGLTSMVAMGVCHTDERCGAFQYLAELDCVYRDLWGRTYKREFIGLVCDICLF